MGCQKIIRNVLMNKLSLIETLKAGVGLPRSEAAEIVKIFFPETTFLRKSTWRPIVLEG